MVNTRIGKVVAALSLLGVLGLWANPKPNINWGTHNTMDISEVRPGMVFYGITRQASNELQVFQFKVISLKYYLGTYIWGEISGNESIEFSGLQQGMSGSPVYYKDPKTGEDKIVGAIAVGGYFFKKARGGVTPIREMLKTLNHNDRKTNESYMNAKGWGTSGSPMGYPTNDDLLPAFPETKDENPTGIQQFSKEFFGLKKVFNAHFSADLFPLVHTVSHSGLAGGLTQFNNSTTGSASPSSQPKSKDFYEVKPGDAVGVATIRGDLTLGGLGTATYVKGNKVLAFGHPMMAGGRMSLPFYKGFVDEVMPLQTISHKMSYLTHEVGTMVQDLQPAILGEVGPAHVKKENWVPVTIRFKSPYTEKTFNYEVAAHKNFLMGYPAGLMNFSILSLGDYESPVSEVTATYKVRLHLDYNNEVLELERQSTGRLAGAARQAAYGLFMTSYQILNNPFLEAKITKVEQELEIKNLISSVSIDGLFADNRDYKPGETVSIAVRMASYKQAGYTKELNFTLPENIHSGKHVVFVSSAADHVRYEMSRSRNRYNARSFSHLLQVIRKNFEASERELIAWMPVRADGYVVKDTEYKNLPYLQRQLLKNSLYTRKLITSGGYVFSDMPVVLEDNIHGSSKILINVKQ